MKYIKAYKGLIFWVGLFVLFVTLCAWGGTVLYYVE